MVTYFLSRDEVGAYLRDFLSRLERFDPFPTTWCPVTKSGRELLKELLPIISEDYPDLAKKIIVVPVGVSETTQRVVFSGNAKKYITDKSVLLFDSSMHTGRTMCRIVNRTVNLGASSIAIYSLVIKRGSKLIPTMWGIIVDDTDRVYFLLNKIPNGRLDSGPEFKKEGPKRHIRPVFIRCLCQEHLLIPLVKSGVESLDRVTWGDRHFDMLAGGNKECTYVLQSGSSILGYMSVHFSDPTCLFITEIAIDQSLERKGYGAILIRFADTLARQSDCEWVRLNAIKNRVKWYKSFDYVCVRGREEITLDDEVYLPMEHKIVQLPFKLT